MIRVSLFVSLVLCIALQTVAQTPKKPPVSSLCTRTNALDNTRQQILYTRTFDQVVPRIAVLLRAADLLWPYEQDKALAAFMEAFDLATQNYKEHGDQVRRSSDSQLAARLAVPDQRYKVIAALAKRDPVGARKLSDQMLKEGAQDAADKAGNAAGRTTTDKLLTVANGLIESDHNAALSFARASLRYPATLQLTGFMYNLAKVNRGAADQFYQEALAAYGRTTMDQFLYLSAYPFGNQRDAGEMPGYTIYRIPEGYEPNVELQRIFVQMLLARAQRVAETTVQTNSRGLTDQSQIWIALSRLEKQIQTNLPDLFDSAVQTRDRLYALLNPQMQTRVTGTISRDTAPKKSFDEQVEAAEKLADADERDQGFTFAVLGAGKTESVERVVSVIEKISDSKVRDAVFNWFYFFRTQASIEDKQLDEARKLASKVVELDQRAYLFSRIAEKSLEVSQDQTQAREMLNEISDAAAKAPKTIVAARTVLALAHLYAKFDVNRGIEELGNSVRLINTLESPDFANQFSMVRIEGKTFASFGSYQTPGFNPENAFREMGKIDFDGSLTHATAFADKSLRALTTLAVIEPCFESGPARRAPKKSKS